VPAARDALEAAAREQGWAAERIHDSDTFCRLVIRSDTAEVVTDLTVDTPPDFPASSTAAGPTLAPEELAGRKLLALFDRAAVRDFATRMCHAPSGYLIRSDMHALPAVHFTADLPVELSRP
jgi:hypothetical protein